ncbi:MAG: cytochrome c1 [Lysobacterales bacterium]
MTRSIFSLLAGLLFATTVQAAGGGALLAQAEAQVSDQASLQRGAQLYFNYCSGCHGIKYMRYSRIAKDLNLSEEQLMANLVFTGAKPGELVTAAMPAASSAWFGAAPPDLSLTARSRGVDWIYSYLKGFYIDPERPLGWNNTVFPGASMPNVLWERQGIQKLAEHHDAHAEGGHGPAFGDQFEQVSEGSRSGEQFDQDARDIANFLQYVGEPAALQREHYGVWVFLYLVLLTCVLYVLKHEFWRDVH